MILALTVAFSSGCSLGLDFSPKEQTYFTIVEKQLEPSPEQQKFPLDLVVREVRSTPFLNGRKIVFGNTPETRGYYQFASWVEPLPKRFGNLLVDALRDSAMFESVGKSSLSARGDLEIVAELVECYHSTIDPPGEARIIVDADILETKTGEVVSHRRFEKNVPSPSFDANGAVHAIGDGLYAVIADINGWVSTIAPTIQSAIKTAPRT